ncbi:RICIN domain-containing protein [Olsenella sp. HMSC062G07]|uniref:RICIN domain-containing protein n=1 Tax=Olsenella sp. HMSC062G07 TaxID=1739330 RepID=UPI0008A3187F|nr:RICIN domain-containing protein [Olsenella sp. HMSC062G07]OFK23328.1 hypothetical protein HMPREF2826_05320 [Olsenella sp. HMSC062G07]
MHASSPVTAKVLGAAVAAVILPFLMTPTKTLALEGAPMAESVDAAASRAIWSEGAAMTSSTTANEAAASATAHAATTKPVSAGDSLTADSPEETDDSASPNAGEPNAGQAPAADSLPSGDAAENPQDPATPAAHVAQGAGADDALGEAAASENPASGADAPRQATGTAAKAPAQVVRDGLYEITAGTSSSLRLDVSGGSTADGARVQVWSANDSSAQRWKITAGSDGYYTIMNVGTGKYLDVRWAAATSGAHVQQYSGNASYAQQWRIVPDAARAGYFMFLSRLDESLALDVPGASSASGARIQLYARNGSSAQSFCLSRLQAAIDDGVYVVANSGSGHALDVNAASLADGANVQQYAPNGTLAQAFRLSYDAATGYYTVINAQSGKVLDVAGGRSGDCTNVQQYASNGSAAQRWVIRRLDDGTFGFFSAIDGRALDIASGSLSSCANVQTFRWNGTRAQRWTLSATTAWLKDDSYELVCAANTRIAVAVGRHGGPGEGALTTSVRKPANPYRKWRLVRGHDGYVHLVNLATGLALTASPGGASGDVIGQSAYTGAHEQQWLPVLTTGGIMLQSRLSPSVVMDIRGGSTSAGATVQTFASNGTPAQRFLFVPTSLLATNRSYHISSAAFRTMSVDVPGASTAAGQDVWLYTSNGTAAQMFYVEDAGNGRVRLMNANSRLYLSSTPGDEYVRQVTSRDAASSLWTVSFGNDINALRLTNAATGLVITSGTNARGANAALFTTAQSTGDVHEGFFLVPVRVSSQGRLNGIDIASYQAGIDLSKVPCDFVMVKATQGARYVNPTWKTMADQALSLGKLLGFYHFVSTGAGAIAEATHFVDTVRDYVGRAILVLDWENNDITGEQNLSRGPAYAKAFLDKVYELTGVRPLIYTSKSVTREYDWSSVASSGYGLWVAQYANMAPQHGYNPDPWTDGRGYGAWDAPTMFQYTSTGYLSGWGSPLDLDVFYGDEEAWNELASRT